MKELHTRCGHSAPRDGALDAIRRTMAYVGASVANSDAFSQAPVTVLRTAAAGLAPEDVSRAERALEEVLSVAHLDLARHAQALLGVVASVIRANP